MSHEHKSNISRVCNRKPVLVSVACGILFY